MQITNMFFGACTNLTMFLAKSKSVLGLWALVFTLVGVQTLSAQTLGAWTNVAGTCDTANNTTADNSSGYVTSSSNRTPPPGGGDMVRQGWAACL